MAQKCQKSLIIFAAALAFASFVYPATVFAEEEQMQLDLISQNCSSIKNQLRQLQKNDAKNRVQLGSYYEIISSKMMQNLNLRLVKNNIAVGDLSTQQSDFSTQQESFKKNFIKYSQELENLIAIDCKEHSQDFLTQLTKTRKARTKVSKNIQKMKEILKNHEKSLGELHEELSK